jgi:hypothetical protein
MVTKRRTAKTVTITGEQRRRLERLWFYYGNYGPKSTPGNHSFIQGFLEHGIDTRSSHTRRTPKSEIPAPECEAAVEAVLAMKSGTVSGDEVAGQSGLRVISSASEHRHSDPDPEMKIILGDMRRRYRVMHERINGDGDTPEAA